MPASASPNGLPNAPWLPERIGDYRVLLPIGHGGMATVYLAQREAAGGFRHHVALKWVQGSLPGFSELAVLLLREARLVGQIRHPNVVQVMDAGEVPEGIFLVMEYVEGGTLAGLADYALTQGGPLPMPIALRILSDALVGLHAAHELSDDQGRSLALVHRDFSPQNILLGVTGEVKLSDFGIAKVDHTSHRTRTGIVKGTVSYMSPEQVRGHSLDRRSDLWSAGVVAWETFAGKRMHEKREAIATAMSTLTGRIPRLRSVRPELPEALDDAVAAALTRDPQRRCQTALELRDRLLAAAQVAPADEQQLAAYAQLAFARDLLARREEVERALRSPARVALVPARVAAVGSSEGERTERGEPKSPARVPRRLWLVAAALLPLFGLVGAAFLRARASARHEVRAAASASTEAGASQAPMAEPLARRPELDSAPSAATASVNAPREQPLAQVPKVARKPASGVAAAHPRLEPSATAPLKAVPPLADNPYAHGGSATK